MGGREQEEESRDDGRPCAPCGITSGLLLTSTSTTATTVQRHQTPFHLYHRYHRHIPRALDGLLDVYRSGETRTADGWKWGLHATVSSIANPRIVYSTGSLNPVVDEAVIAAALKANSEFYLLDSWAHLPAIHRRPGLHTWLLSVDRTPTTFVPTYIRCPPCLDQYRCQRQGSQREKGKCPLRRRTCPNRCVRVSRTPGWALQPPSLQPP
ncbi:hypothetical protein DFP72DRAFT_505145 [Ephemerocybe angulata]|uniref:Uncharacterized protein n=1 Tax=Ephemerocybe angulata TaxID=980116 RepID=A0A8H6M1D3_9AGAR|nr:hypothetical protein DFP72DRAFT_505145 [Tulosesus angulatus]